MGTILTALTGMTLVVGSLAALTGMVLLAAALTMQLLKALVWVMVQVMDKVGRS